MFPISAKSTLFVMVFNLCFFECLWAQSIFDELQLMSPVQSETFELSSPFGPRLKASDNFRYDFHRGIDIPGFDGDPIYAVSAGVIHNVYREGNDTFPNGGNVIVVRHDLAEAVTFQGQLVDRVFSLYLHLEGFGDAANAFLAGAEDVLVQRGEQIGTMGRSGTTDFTHLHFEFRIQTTCSLAYQMNHPETQCAQLGFDPHINYMGLLKQAVDPSRFSLEVMSADQTRLRLRATGPRDALVVDGLQLQYYAGLNGPLVYSETLSFNQRTGIDARSTASIDQPQQGRFLIEPARFSVESDFYEIQFEFSLPTQLNDPEIMISADLLTTAGTVAQVTHLFECCAHPLDAWNQQVESSCEVSGQLNILSYIPSVRCLP